MLATIFVGIPGLAADVNGYQCVAATGCVDGAGYTQTNWYRAYGFDTIVGVYFIPNARIVGRNIDTRIFQLWNLTDSVALAELQMDLGVDLPSGSGGAPGPANEIPIVGDPSTEPGKYFEWRALTVGDGFPVPGGRLYVYYA